MSESQLKSPKISQVTAQLLADHAKIRQFLQEIRAYLQDISQRQATASLEQAQTVTRSLVQFLNSHAEREERVVFPVLVKEHPVLAVEAEHDEITLKQVVTVSGIANYSFPEDCTESFYRRYLEFQDLLYRHLAKEETLILPLIEELPEDEKAYLWKRMQELQA